MARLPLWVEMSGRRVLVVGGGRVGTRRALMFRGAGAEVTVVGLGFSGELVERARGDPGLRLVEMDARDEARLEELVKWADIVVVATPSSEVNDLAWRLARRHRRWVNDATDASRTEIVVPYRLSLLGGALEVAVTTEGRSGVVARHAKDKIRRCLEGDRELETLYEAMWRIKPVLKALIPDGRRRFPVYFEAEKRVLEAIASGGGVEEALHAAARTVAEAVERETGRKLGVDEVLEMMKRVEKPVEPLREAG